MSRRRDLSEVLTGFFGGRGVRLSWHSASLDHTITRHGGPFLQDPNPSTQQVEVGDILGYIGSSEPV